MNKLSQIRTLRDLEYQRALLQLQVMHDEKNIKSDIEAVKKDYAPIVTGVQNLKSGISHLKAAVSVVTPILRFIWRRRSNSKR